MTLQHNVSTKYQEQKYCLGVDNCIEVNDVITRVETDWIP